MSNNNYSWKFDDSKNRSTSWYIIALAFVLGISIWGFFTKQYGMSFIFLLIAGLFYFTENNSPKYIGVNINESGIKIAETFYNYNSINYYQFINKDNKTYILRFNLNNRGLKYIDVKVENMNENEIREILSSYIEEEDERELNLSEKFIYLLKL